MTRENLGAGVECNDPQGIDTRTQGDSVYFFAIDRIAIIDNGSIKSRVLRDFGFR